MTLVSVSGVAADAVARHVPVLVAERFASRLSAGDDTLWGPDAQSEASIRLGWVHASEHSRPLIPEITALHDEFRARGLNRIVLCGMGGSSLAPEVITRTEGVPLVVLDTTHPTQLARVVDTDIETTVVVVSSTSGSTVETDSHKRAFEAAFTAAGIDAPVLSVKKILPRSAASIPREACCASTRCAYANPFLICRLNSV